MVSRNTTAITALVSNGNRAKGKLKKQHESIQRMVPKRPDLFSLQNVNLSGYYA